MNLRVLLVSSLLLLTAAAPTESDEKPQMTGLEIVNRHLEAVGGKEALGKIKSRVAIGIAKKDSDAAVPVSIMSEAPKRVSAIYQFQGFNWQLSYDGAKAVVRPVISRAASVVMHKYEEMLASGTMFNDVSLCNALLDGSEGIEFKAKGTRKVKGRQAYVVEMKRGKDPAVSLYFDADTFMWVRTDYGSVRITRDMGTFTNARVAKDEESTVDFFVETSEFKDVGGIKLPFRVEIVATAPILQQKNVGTIVTNISEYRQNIAIDPKMFQ